MKNCSKDQLEASRPDQTALDAVGFCLDQLFEDTDTELGNEVVNGLSYEELIGALLLARDDLK